MMITIAAASVIKGIILLIWGSETRTIEPFFGNQVIHVFGATLTSQALCVLVLVTIVTVGLSLFLSRTIFGKALRASAINETGARLMGIDISRFRLFCFALAGGLGAITGIVITPITFTGYNTGMLTGLKDVLALLVMIIFLISMERWAYRRG
jgi:branched-chain amino acid transport system permease protein